MPSLWGWFMGRPGNAAYYVNRYAPWLVKKLPVISRTLPWAMAAYLTIRHLRSR